MTPRPEARARPARAAARLGVRLLRRSTLLLSAAVAVWAVTEVASYRAAYPGGVTPVQFAMFADNPAVRMMQGLPEDIGTAGGFTAWDAGWMLMLLMAVWALLSSTRLLSGEEESGRTELMLVGPVRPGRALAAMLGVLVAAGVVVSVAAAVALAVSTGEWRGPLLLGALMAGVAATFAGVGAVASQLVEVRRRAVGLSLGLVGLAWVVRMAANSDDDRTWLLWTTPLGWLDLLRPFGPTEYDVLVPLTLVPLALLVLALALRHRRDLGSGLVVARRAPRSRLGALSSPSAFAWRSTRGSLLAWAVGIGLYSAVFGGLTATMVTWLEQDEQYRALMESFGFGAMLSIRGFVAVMTSFAVVAVALQVVWRIGAARSEEESGRLEQLLARPVPRWRWLVGHVVQALLGGLALLVVAGAALWIGSWLAGSSELPLVDALKATLNGAPVVVLALGVTVLAFGLLPRTTVALPAALVPVAYLLTMLGAPLGWPGAVLDLSPFTHLALVPLEPWAATSGAVMTMVGVGLLVAGVLSFRRRDVEAS